jgi:hypothetical protein
MNRADMVVVGTPQEALTHPGEAYSTTIDKFPVTLIAVNVQSILASTKEEKELWNSGSVVTNEQGQCVIVLLTTYRSPVTFHEPHLFFLKQRNYDVSAVADIVTYNPSNALYTYIREIRLCHRTNSTFYTRLLDTTTNETERLRMIEDFEKDREGKLVAISGTNDVNCALMHVKRVAEAMSCVPEAESKLNSMKESKIRIESETAAAVQARRFKAVGAATHKPPTP